jgi:hypothetical protein
MFLGRLARYYVPGAVSSLSQILDRESAAIYSISPSLKLALNCQLVEQRS